ncbi:MAG: glycoside hydrolase family 3 protein [Halanaerobiales bacterium]
MKGVICNNEQPEKILAEMKLEEKIGQMLHLGVLENEDGWPSSEMEEVIKIIQPAAVRIYAPGPRKELFFKAHYTNQLQQWATETRLGLPLLVSADCEFGIGDIVEYGYTAFPFLRGRAKTGSNDLNYKIAVAIAAEAKAAGLNMLHQPVVDVNTNSHNPVIGVRSAGNEPQIVIKYSRELLKGLKQNGIITVGKHYPGHGDTELDSHKDLPVVNYNYKTFINVHLAPFSDLIKAGVEGIMSSHVLVKTIDDRYPATLSRKILTGLLREKQKFTGFIMTDALKMKAIDDNYNIDEAVIRAVKAGVDLLLLNGDYNYQMNIRDILLTAARDGVLSEDRIDKSVLRILKLKDKYRLQAKKKVNPAHVITKTGFKDLARETYLKSYTKKDKRNLLPLTGNERLLITGVKEVTTIAAELSKEDSKITTYYSDAAPENNWNPSAEDIKQAVMLTEMVDKAIVLTYCNDDFPGRQIKLVKQLNKKIPVIVISLGFPQEKEEFTEDITIISTALQNSWGQPSPLPDTSMAALRAFLYKNKV